METQNKKEQPKQREGAEGFSGENLGGLGPSESGKQLGPGLVKPGGTGTGEISGRNLGTQSPIGTIVGSGENLDNDGMKMDTEESEVRSLEGGGSGLGRGGSDLGPATPGGGGAADTSGEGEAFRRVDDYIATKSMRRRMARRQKLAKAKEGPPTTPPPPSVRRNDEGTSKDKGNKRNRSINETPPEDRAPKRPTAGGGLGKTYAAAAGSDIKFGLAVVLGDYPRAKLVKDQVRLLEEGITEKILELGEEARVPQFLERRLVRGALLVSCEAAEDRDWLKRTVPSLESWEGANLRTLSPEELEVYEKCIIYTASGRDGQTILRALGRQNARIETGAWELVHFVKEAGSGDSSVMVYVPREQWAIIDGLNRKLNFGLGKAHCVLLRREGAKRKEPREPGATSSTSETSSAEETKILSERKKRQDGKARKAQKKPSGARKAPEVEKSTVQTVNLSFSPE